MIIEYRGKKLNIRDDLYDWAIHNFIDFEELDIDSYLDAVLTREINGAFVSPNIERYADNHNEGEIAALVEKYIKHNHRAVTGNEI